MIEILIFGLLLLSEILLIWSTFDILHYILHSKTVSVDYIKRGIMELAIANILLLIIWFIMR